MPTTLELQAETVDRGSRRSGGREARRAMRAAPLADDVRPIRPGLEGGSYKPLAENDLERIHEAVLTLLETVGFANAIPTCIEALTRVGAIHRRRRPHPLSARAGLDDDQTGRAQFHAARPGSRSTTC